MEKARDGRWLAVFHRSKAAGQGYRIARMSAGELVPGVSALVDRIVAVTRNPDDRLWWRQCVRRSGSRCGGSRSWPTEGGYPSRQGQKPGSTTHQDFQRLRRRSEGRPPTMKGPFCSRIRRRSPGSLGPCPPPRSRSCSLLPSPPILKIASSLFSRLARLTMTLESRLSRIWSKKR